MELSVLYYEIPNFTEATVEFHKRRMGFGLIGKKEDSQQAGKLRSYEKYGMKQISDENIWERVSVGGEAQVITFRYRK